MLVTNYYTVNGEIIGEKSTGTPRLDYLTDALGSVTATMDQSAQVVNTYRYKPYGAQHPLWPGACPQIFCGTQLMQDAYYACSWGNIGWFRNKGKRVAKIDGTKHFVPPNIKFCVGQSKDANEMWVRPMNCDTVALLTYTAYLSGQTLFAGIWQKFQLPQQFKAVIPKFRADNCA